MRIWSLHPKYLDARGLVALWREGLLAQAVLSGATRGYVHHPQLARFRESASAVQTIAEYLRAVHDEAAGRGYRFDARKIRRPGGSDRLAVTCGQLDFEWRHLMRKLEERAPQLHARLHPVDRPDAHPLFVIVDGGIASWERSAERDRNHSVTHVDKKLFRNYNR